MKKIILGAALLAFSTASFAGFTVKCDTPWGTEVFDPVEVKQVWVNKEGTHIALSNGLDKWFTPAIPCIVTEDK
jgi:hypothetical protein